VLVKNIEAETGTNWLQVPIHDVLDLQRKLGDSNAQTGDNQQIRQHYEEAMAKVKEARDFINRLAAVFYRVRF
jgi:hypothetical protein